MSIILTVYSSNAFKRFLLPAINDADYAILLSESLFNLPENIELKLEITDNEWRFKPSEEYELAYLTGEEDPYIAPLRNEEDPRKNEYKLLIEGQHILSIIVHESGNCFAIYDHFDIAASNVPLSIGREASNAISFDYRERHLVSGEHATIFRNGSDVIFQDLNSANGSYINNRRVTGSVLLAFGDCIDIFGLRIVFLGDQIAVNVSESGAKINPLLLQAVAVSAPPLAKVNKRRLMSIFHRSPRRISRLETEGIKIDEPPASKEEIKRGGVLAAVGNAFSMSLPMLLGCFFMIYASQVTGMSRGIFMYVGLVTAVSSAIIGTIRSIAGMKRAVRDYEAYERLRNEKYGKYLQEQETSIREKYEKNTYALRDRYVSAQECSTYNTKQPLLWSRNVNQPDFLSHRLGIGNLPFQVEVQVPDKKFSMTDNNLLEIPSNIKKTYSELKDVPVCVDLLEEKLIGVIGGRRMTGGIQVVRDLLVQLAANNSYTDVKIALVYDRRKAGLENEWGFVRWLPHVWNEMKTFRYIASDKGEASDVFYELNRIFRQRAEEGSIPGANRDKMIPRPYYVLIVAAPEFLEGELIAQTILENNPVHGLTTIYMTERYEQLPNQCEFIVENDETYSGIYHVSDDYEDRIAVQFDEVSTEEAGNLASAVAGIEVQEIETGGDIPNSVTFFEMYGIKKLEDLDVLNRWRKNRTWESMKALVGQKAGGAPCYLDIHEKYHGPHGLVAGTTGSGKSETLQTYMLSLAINFSPDDVAFFVIDYKGGGMANLFTDLPHMIGSISNLSGNQINRALVSVQSEKDRREALFANYGVKDIRDYTKLYKNNEASVPLPHLIIVIDEFAEMKKEEPEFIQEIVSVSRVGRSLGIHLIMATQKPAGSVSDDIWANSRFKLCLRVQSKQDSADMLHKPDAAYLTQSGRCYLQVGNDELYELFQSGYSGAVYYDDEEDVSTDIARMLTVDGVASIEGNHARLNRQKAKKVQWIDSLLSVIRKVCGDDPAQLENQFRQEKDALISRIFRQLEQEELDYPETEHNKENLITLLEQIHTCGYDAAKIIEAEDRFTNAKKKLPTRPERTQLEAIVAYLKDVAEKNHYDHDFSLFLPLLPDRIGLTDLPASNLPWNAETVFNGTAWPQHSGKWTVEVGMGLYDDPENQRQDVFGIDFAKTGNILLFGAPSTGKTTFLQTLVYGMIHRYSPAEVNLYLMEFSARRFSAFEQAPQVGGIIRDSDENERIDKFFTMLTRLLAERKKSLGDAGFDQYVAANGIGSVPAVFVIIDNFAALVGKVGDRYHPFLGQLVKEGISNGIFLVISAAGTGGSEIPNNLAQNFRSAICLEMNNAYDYGTYMRAAHLKLYPESGVKGRGIGYVGERVLEFQTALPFIADNDLTVVREIEKTAARMRDAWKGDPAFAIPEIPEDPTWELFSARKDVRQMLATDRMLPIGYDAKFAEPVGLDLSGFYTVLLTGAKKKGKTSALKLMMHSAAGKGGEIVIVDFNRQFAGIAQELGAKHLTTETAWAEFLSALFRDEIAPRNACKGDLLDRGAEDDEIYGEMQKFKKIFIFIDDLADFVDHMAHPREKGVPANLMVNMEMIVERGALHNLFWFVTLDKERAMQVSTVNLYRLFIRDHKGMHFGGAVHSTCINGMNFDNHDRKTMDQIRPAGRAMLPSDNEMRSAEVVLPMVKGKPHA